MESNFESFEFCRHRVEQVVRLALAQGFGDDPEKVPPVLVEATAGGEGDRQRIVAATQDAFGDLPPCEFVVFDTDQIGSYVFESARPPVIAGASRILSDINDYIEEKYTNYVIFSGGGGGYLLVPRGRGTQICEEIQREFETRTAGALGVTTDCLPVAPSDFVAAGAEAGMSSSGLRLVSGTQAVQAAVRDRIRQKKDERLPSWAAVSGSSKRCLSCRDRAGTQPVSIFRDEEEGLICEACIRRWEVGKTRIEGKTFEEIVRSMDDFDTRSKASYLGFVYADGNAMGAVFSGVRSLSELRFLSRTVGSVFRQLHRRVREWVAERTAVQTPERVPLLEYLGGGDEAIWILPGYLAVEISEKLPQWLRLESAAIEDAELGRILKGAGVTELTVGIGLVLCHLKYPVRYQFEWAKALQKNAKSLFYASRHKSLSCIDFEVLTDDSPMMQKLETLRSLIYASQQRNFHTTSRPYTAESFSRLLGKLRSAVEGGLGKSQLYALQQNRRRCG